MVRICGEGTFHHKQGQEMIRRYAQGTPRQQQMAQDALNRWWWPSMMMLGPHDSDSPNTPQLKRWGVKVKTNDEVRQEFLDEQAPDLLNAGLTSPAPELRFDESTGHWVHGHIDWHEFWNVVNGNGPCNAQRLAARQAAHDDGRWVREALSAYAAKQASGPSSAAVASGTGGAQA